MNMIENADVPRIICSIPRELVLDGTGQSERLELPHGSVPGGGLHIVTNNRTNGRFLIERSKEASRQVSDLSGNSIVWRIYWLSGERQLLKGDSLALVAQSRNRVVPAESMLEKAASARAMRIRLGEGRTLSLNTFENAEVVSRLGENRVAFRSFRLCMGIGTLAEMSLVLSDTFDLWKALGPNYDCGSGVTPEYGLGQHPACLAQMINSIHPMGVLVDRIPECDFARRKFGSSAQSLRINCTDRTIRYCILEMGSNGVQDPEEFGALANAVLRVEVDLKSIIPTPVVLERIVAESED